MAKCIGFQGRFVISLIHDIARLTSQRCRDISSMDVNFSLVDDLRPVVEEAKLRN